MPPKSIEQQKLLEIPYRFSLAKEWVGAAKRIVMVTKDPRALKLYKFLQQQSTLGVLLPGAKVQPYFITPPSEEMDNYLFLIPLLPQDKQRLASEYGDILAHGEHETLVQYRAWTRAIILPPQPFGRIGKGLLLLHETMHAWFDTRSKKQPEERIKMRWLEESYVYRFEFHLLSKIIGPEYDQLVSRICRNLSVPGSTSYSFRYADRQLISRRLGCLSERETVFWLKTTVAMNAYYRYYQQHAAHPNQSLASLLERRYQKS